MASAATATTAEEPFVTLETNAELMPIVIGVIRNIQGQYYGKSLTLLCDSGATST